MTGNMIRKIKNSGFTIIETLVAVLILATALAGPLTIASRSLNAALIAKDQVAAYYLAEDAVEYVRFVRDSNKLSNNADWLAGLDGTANGHTTISGSCINASNGCIVDSTADSVTACVSTCTPLKFDPPPSGTGTNLYKTTGTVLPAYTRTVTITTPVGANDCTAGHGCEALLTVTVTWTDIGGITHPGITTRENLFDWQ